MAEKTTYELKGTLRDECMTSRATLDGFHPPGKRLAGTDALAHVRER